MLMPSRAHIHFKENTRLLKNSVQQCCILNCLYKTFCRYTRDAQKIKAQLSLEDFTVLPSAQAEAQGRNEKTKYKHDFDKRQVCYGWHRKD